MAKASSNGNLGVVDAIAGAVLFTALLFLIEALLDAVVPGLLKTETRNHVLVSGLMFLFVWSLLGNFAFKPFLDVMEEREERTEGNEAHAAEKRREIVRLEKQIEEELRQARLEGIRARDARLEEARIEAQKITDAAQSAAEEELSRAEQQIQQLKEQARGDVSREAGELSNLVVGRALAIEPSQIVH